MKTLHIVKENQVMDLSIEEIFDAHVYDTFKGITFSVSPQFINIYLANFRSIDIVVGIPEYKVQMGANLAAKEIEKKIEADLKSEPIELYQDLTTQMKTKLAKNKIDIQTPLGCSIHSKFYLLKNSTTGDTRLILGSANLSEQAFRKETHQFENILIFDNSDLYRIYEDYLAKELSPFLTPFLPEKLLEMNAKRITQLMETDEESESIEEKEAVLLNNEEVELVKKTSIIATVKDTEEKIQQGILSVEIKNEMRNIMDDRQEIERKQKENQKIEKLAYTLVKETIQPRKKEPTLKNEEALDKLVTKYIDIKVVQSHNEHVHERKWLVNQPAQRNSHKELTGLFTQSSLDKERLLMFGERATTSSIKESLMIIHEFLKTFEKYTIKYDDDYGSRIMEALLYTFTSPFLFEIKQKARSEEERNDIPQFLFLGGAAGSGKSSFLKALSKLLGTLDKPYYDYNALIPQNVHHHKSKRIALIESWMSETNVNPLLIDELPEDFFAKQEYGNDLIVNLSNRMALNSRAAPVFIGTTNSEGYTLSERARRRSYYLKVDKIFDEAYRLESQPEYNHVYRKMNNTLFKDFVVRFSSLLEDDELNWEHFEHNGKIDFLYHTREVFKEYYRLADMSLPEYFPTSRYDDSQETNQEKWRKLYSGTSQVEFKFHQESGHLFFKMSILDENAGRRFGGALPSNIYRNALSPKVVVGSKDGTDIELDTIEFFEWIDIENPYKTVYKEQLKKQYVEEEAFYTKEKGDILAIDAKVLTRGNVDLINQYSYYIPDSVVKELNTQTAEFYKQDFLKWLGVKEKGDFLINWFSKLE